MTFPLKPSIEPKAAIRIGVLSVGFIINHSRTRPNPREASRWTRTIRQHDHNSIQLVVRLTGSDVYYSIASGISFPELDLALDNWIANFLYYKNSQSMPKNNTKSSSRPRRDRPKHQQTQAELADKFACYQRSVQTAEHEVEFFEQAYKDAYGRRPTSLREDFCGTFSVCCEWVKSKKSRTAVGVDLCAETLRWGSENNLSKLKKHQKDRLEVLCDDVRSGNDQPADVLAAQNFSFWIFKTRTEVIEYFKTALSNLQEKGVMILDMMGGGDCYEVGQVDKRKIGKGKKTFRYEWEQAKFNPVTRDASFYIHFRFPDGSRMDRAFEYHWRFWTIPEVREMLAEAGFRETHVYWEQEDDDGEDTGEWKRTSNPENSDAWICYIVAVK